MTRKDYVKFAAMLKAMHITCDRDIKNGHTPDNPNIIVSCIEYRIADILETDNPNFDRERFLTACGVES